MNLSTLLFRLTASLTNVMVKRVKPRSSRRLTRPLRQGVAAITRSPGIATQKASKKKTPRTNDALCLNAMMPHHLPLPRAVGPYTVTRSTKFMQSNLRTIMFGTFKSGDDWTNVGAVGLLDNALAVTATGNSKYYPLPGISRAALGAAASLVPAAMTIQIMNPEALQTTNGICFLGAMNMVPKVGNTTRTGEQFATEFISFNKPRLCAAAKLALTGVECHLPPMNMSDLADFTQLPAGGTTDYVGTWVPGFECAGFAPFVVHNPDAVNLQFLVTVEYRLRFDIAHPAASTHVYHKPAPLDRWHRVLDAMVAAGHGVREIAAIASSVGAVATSLKL